MHITPRYSVFQPWPNFYGERRPNKLHKQIGIQSFVLHGGNKMLDFRELLLLLLNEYY